MADQEKEILEEEMEQDLSDAEELKEEETEDEEPVSKEDKKAAKKQALNWLMHCKSSLTLLMWQMLNLLLFTLHPQHMHNLTKNNKNLLA